MSLLQLEQPTVRCWWTWSASQVATGQWDKDLLPTGVSRFLVMTLFSFMHHLGCGERCVVVEFVMDVRTWLRAWDKFDIWSRTCQGWHDHEAMWLNAKSWSCISMPIVLMVWFEASLHWKIESRPSRKVIYSKWVFLPPPFLDFSPIPRPQPTWFTWRSRMCTWLRRARMCRCTFRTHLLLPLIRLWRKRRATPSRFLRTMRSLCSSIMVPVTTSFDVS